VVVCPATAQILAQLNLGLCSDGTSTFLQSALGANTPLILFPAMHESLFESPRVAKNLQELSMLPGVSVVLPEQREGKRKVPTPEQTALETAHFMNKHQLQFQLLNEDAKTNPRAMGPKAIVTGGGTRSHIDPVRCVTNISSGSFAGELARALYARGVAVTFLKAQTSVEPPSGAHLKVMDVPEYEQLKKALEAQSLDKGDGLFHLAAVSDYLVKNASEKKISSQNDSLEVQFSKAPKLFGSIQTAQGAFRMGAKLTSSAETSDRLVAEKLMDTQNLNVCVWNTQDALTNRIHEAIVLERKGNQISALALAGKRQLADHVASRYLEHFQKMHSRSVSL
jgi:phosphopantothenoylcysteine decarboxylase / phosphopantothenate---cysteine ligase